MGKISTYTYDTVPVTTDYFLGNQASGPTTFKYKIGDVINAGVMTVPYKFFAYRNAAYSQSSVTYIFDAKVYDTGNNYSTTTGLFTALVAGFYRFTASTPLAIASAGVAIGHVFYKNATAYLAYSIVTTYNAVYNEGMPCPTPPILLAAGDTISVVPYASGTAVVGASPIWSFFAGELVAIA